MQDGLNQLPASKEAQEGGLDRQAQCIMQEAWGAFKSHNTHDCHHFNKDDTPIKNRGGASKPQHMKRGPEGANVMQLMHTEIKKALHKHTRKDKKCHMCKVDSDSNSNDST